MARIGYPIPLREREIQARGASEVKPYYLSPEELERYRAQTKKPIHGITGQVDKPPVGVPNTKIDHSSEKQRERAMKRYGGADMAKHEKDKPTNGPTRKEFLQMIADGETISSIERAYGLKFNTLQYWVVKKWALKGITPGKARELLGSAKQEAMVTAETSKGGIVDGNTIVTLGIDAREKIIPLDELHEHTIIQTNPKLATDNEVERLKAEIARLTDDNNVLAQDITKLSDELAEVVRQRDDYKRAAEELESKILQPDKHEPAGDVEWFSPEVTVAGPSIAINKSGLTVNDAATERLGLKADDSLMIGFKGNRLVLKKDSRGVRVKKSGKQSVEVRSVTLVNWLEKKNIEKKRYPLKLDNGVYFVEVEVI